MNAGWISIAITVAGMGFGIWTWFAKRWLSQQIVTLLRNDDTPIAVYQHETRDKVTALAKAFDDMREDSRETARIMSQHISDSPSAREYKQIAEMVHETLNVSRENRTMMVEHVTDRSLHKTM